MRSKTLCCALGAWYPPRRGDLSNFRSRHRHWQDHQWST